MSILIKNYLKILLNSLISFWKQKKLFFVFGIVFLLIFQWAIVIVSYYWFSYILDNFPGWYIFVPQILGLIITTTFILMYFAWAIASIWTCFKNDEVKFLLYTAFEYKDIYKYCFVKVAMFASLWVVVFLLPLFVWVWISSWYWFEYYLLSFLTIFFTVWIAVFLWNITLIVLIKKILTLKRKWIKTILYAVIIAVLIISFPISKTVDIWDAETETIFEKYIYSIEFNNILLPWNWINSTLHAYMQSDFMVAIWWVIFLLITSVLIFQIVWYIWRNFFFQAYNIYEEFSLTNKNLKDKKSFFTSKKYLNLFTKDLLLYLKDSSWWVQFLMLAVLVSIYMIILNWINVHELQTPFAASTISVGNIAMTWFLVSAIALKFIYPNISIEWKSFWVLKTLPISFKMIYFIKLLFFFVLFLVIAYIISISYSMIVGMNETSSNLISLLILPITLFIVCFYFALWNVYPNFYEKNPSQISTSIPWLLWVIISNILILLFAGIFYLYFLQYYENLINCNDLWLSHFWVPVVITYLFYTVISVLISIWWYRNFKKLST